MVAYCVRESFAGGGMVRVDRRGTARRRCAPRGFTLVALSVVGVLVGACSTESDRMSSSASTTSESTAVPVSSAVTGSSAATDDPRVPEGFRDDLFTAEAVPLDLAPVPDPATSVTATIGSAGGQLSVTGPDGTMYVLTIPEEDVPEGTLITMVPYSDVGGFPGRVPEHRVGVALYPEGMELAKPATLTITPPVPVPPAGVATLRSRVDGADATFVMHTVSDGVASIQVEHFSGWVAVFPITDVEIREVINQFVTDAAAEFEATVAGMLERLRQKQFLGIASDELLENITTDAEQLVEWYERDVLQLYLLNASSGCFEAGRAIMAYVSYARIMELLGLGEDPRFKRPIPDDLLETRWKLCAAEEFERCVKTGDFPSFQTFLLQIYQHNQLGGGAELPEGVEAEGQNYLRRCGHWNARVSTYFDDDPAVHVEETSADIPIQWEPGSGPFGIFNSTIKGDADITVNNFLAKVWCGTFWTDGSGSDPKTEKRASAQITGLSFKEAPWYLPGYPPTADGLSILIDFGQFTVLNPVCLSSGPGTPRPVDEITYTRAYSSTSWLPQILETEYEGNPNPGDVNSTLWSIAKGWEYDDSPYSANSVQGAELIYGPSRLLGRLEVTVEHTPQ